MARSTRDDNSSTSDVLARLREGDFQPLLDGLPSMIGYWDRNLRNRYGNRAYQAWFGIGSERMGGKHIRDVIGEERYRLNLPYIEKVLQGEPQQFERAIPTPDGKAVRHSLAHYIPDIVNGEVQGFFVLVSDITAVKEAEAAMQEAKHRYDDLVRRIPVGVYTYRVGPGGAQGFEFVSPRFEEIIGVEAGRALADPASAFASIHPDDRAGLERAHAEAIENGRPLRWEGRFLVRGAARWLRIESDPGPELDGVRRWSGVVSDVTDRHLLEEELRLSNTDLRQFAYVASHDLQTPLRNIINYLQMIERRYADKLDDGGREFIDVAVQAAKEMRSLILDLLDYSRVDNRGREFVPVDLDEIVAHALTALEGVILQADAEVVAPASGAWVLGDAIQLGRLVQNLIGNAVKYRSRDRRPSIRIQAALNGGFWTISVADNGIGIAPQYFERIFQIFQRLHTAGEYEGSGIGLAICKRIVERHGGRIRVDSRPGEGSTFTFSLPALRG